MRIKTTCLFLIFIVSVTAYSALPDSLKHFKIGVLPSAFYTPETSVGLGGVIYTHFKLGKDGNASRKSNTQSYVSYTLNKQFTLENDYQIWLKRNLIYLTGALDFSRFTEYFYGIGNDTKESERTMVSFNMIRVHLKNLFQIHDKIYFGPSIQYQNLYNQDVALISANDCMEVHGNTGYVSQGLGPILIIDNRDNPLNPAKGSYLEGSYMDYKNIPGNTNGFTALLLDVRKYKTLFKKLIWNGNVYFAHYRGDVPYRMMPEIGGARFLRGYYRGRFRDNNMAIIQNEFRMPIYKFIAMAAFGGIGSVAKTLSQLKSNEIHYDYGIGLRLRINKKENTNIRVDYGFTKDSRGLYVVFAEAF